MNKYVEIYRQMIDAIIFLNVVDLFMTQYFLNHGHIELNPFLAFLYIRYGFMGSIATVKFSLAVILVFCRSIENVKTYLYLLTYFVFSVYSWLVIYHFSVLTISFLGGIYVSL
jgi:hypothetical protein